tara:strand:- start:204 stop:608 length:405 start_codon:yes stop_codon:yes gene_type:complete
LASVNNINLAADRNKKTANGIVIIMKLVSLKNKSDFDFVFKEKNFLFSADFFKAYVLLQSTEEINYGFIYPKKHIKLAVERNYAKRAAKEMLKTIKLKKGFKIVFLVNMKIDPFEKDKIKKNFAELKRKIEFSS